MLPGLVVGSVGWLSWAFGPVFSPRVSSVSLSGCRLLGFCVVLFVHALCPCVLPPPGQSPRLVLASALGFLFGTRCWCAEVSSLNVFQYCICSLMSVAHSFGFHSVSFDCSLFGTVAFPMSFTVFSFAAMI